MGNLTISYFSIFPDSDSSLLCIIQVSFEFSFQLTQLCGLCDKRFNIAAKQCQFLINHNNHRIDCVLKQTAMQTVADPLGRHRPLRRSRPVRHWPDYTKTNEVIESFHHAAFTSHFEFICRTLHRVAVYFHFPGHYWIAADLYWPGWQARKHRKSEWPRRRTRTILMPVRSVLDLTFFAISLQCWFNDLKVLCPRQFT